MRAQQLCSMAYDAIAAGANTATVNRTSTMLERVRRMGNRDSLQQFGMAWVGPRSIYFNKIPRLVLAPLAVRAEALTYPSQNEMGFVRIVVGPRRMQVPRLAALARDDLRLESSG